MSAFFFCARFGAIVAASGGGGGKGGRGGEAGMSGVGKAGFRPFGEREPARSFVRLGRDVSPASCAATELDLPIAIAPAAGGGSGGGLLLELA